MNILLCICSLRGAILDVIYQNNKLISSLRHIFRKKPVSRKKRKTVAAGTDFGNVSQRVPGIHPLIGVADSPDVALHTREMTRAAGSPTGEAAAVDGAYGLAAVALD